MGNFQWSHLGNEKVVKNIDIQRNLEEYITSFVINTRPADALAPSIYLGRDQMATIFTTLFQMHFLDWKCLTFNWNFTEVDS